jgi:hypothetical protein
VTLCTEDARRPRCQFPSLHRTAPAARGRRSSVRGVTLPPKSLGWPPIGPRSPRNRALRGRILVRKLTTWGMVNRAQLEAGRRRPTPAPLRHPCLTDCPSSSACLSWPGSWRPPPSASSPPPANRRPGTDLPTLGRRLIERQHAGAHHGAAGQPQRPASLTKPAAGWESTAAGPLPSSRRAGRPPQRRGGSGDPAKRAVRQRTP